MTVEELRQAARMSGMHGSRLPEPLRIDGRATTSLFPGLVRRTGGEVLDVLGKARLYERSQAQAEELAHAAAHDVLTGLSNRAALDARKGCWRSHAQPPLLVAGRAGVGELPPPRAETGLPAGAPT